MKATRSKTKKSTRGTTPSGRAGKRGARGVNWSELNCTLKKKRDFWPRRCTGHRDGIFSTSFRCLRDLRSLTSPHHLTCHHVQALITPIFGSSLVCLLYELPMNELIFARPASSDKRQTEPVLIIPSPATGRSRGASPPPRRLVRGSACERSIELLTRSAPPSSGMERPRRWWSAGTRKCRARRKCCPRTSTRSSIKRRRSTERAFTVSHQPLITCLE